MLHRREQHASARTRRTACALVGALVLAATLAVAVPAQAAVYNSLNIISYETWRASSAMSVADIQAFLETQAGPLKSYSCTDTVTASTPVRRTAAEIIWRSAQAWNMNPRVILATLQKEESLITLSNSSNAARLVKAMGCGVYGDADHDGKTDNRFPGFASQIFNGARVLSTYEITYGWYPGKIKRVTAYKNVEATKTVDGQVVTYTKRVSYQKDIKPLNACTFSLYTYTPYYPQKLFWDLYTRYFGDPQASPRLRPLYRFRNRANGTYLYTASEAKRYTLIRTAAKKWHFEGVSFTVDASATTGTVPLYQMYNTRSHKYLYTVSTSQRDSLLKAKPKQWRVDGVVCNVTLESSGTAPVYRLEKKTNHAIVLTSSAALKKSLSTGHSSPFRARGIAFYLGSVEATVPVGPTP
jgi:hypothetical protein